MKKLIILTVILLALSSCTANLAYTTKYDIDVDSKSYRGCEVRIYASIMDEYLILNCPGQVHKLDTDFITNLNIRRTK